MKISALRISGAVIDFAGFSIVDRNSTGKNANVEKPALVVGLPASRAAITSICIRQRTDPKSEVGNTGPKISTDYLTFIEGSQFFAADYSWRFLPFAPDLNLAWIALHLLHCMGSRIVAAAPIRDLDVLSIP